MKLSEIDWEIEKIIESSQFSIKTSSTLSSDEFTAKLLRRRLIKQAQDEFKTLWSSVRKSLRNKAVFSTINEKEDLYVKVPDIISVAGLENTQKVFSKIGPFISADCIPWDKLVSLTDTEFDFPAPRLGYLDLPGAEQYNATEQVLDYSPKEIVNDSPSYKRQDEDPVKKRPDFNYEKLLFEKGLHTEDSFNNVNVSRPITPYGSESMKIEKAVRKDASILARISARTFSKVSEEYHIPPPEGHNDMSVIAKYIANSGCFKLVVNGEIVGGALLDIDQSGNYIYLTRIFIDERFQNRGYGKKFLSRIEAFFPDAKVIGVNTPKVMKDNIQFYESLGYKIEKENNATPLVYFRKELKGAQ